VVFENTSEVEDLVVLRYFGPGVNPEAPEVGAHRGKTPSTPGSSSHKMNG
jgi:hypothetical protein